MSSQIVPKSDLEILSQLIDDETGSYRIRAAERVHYLTIAADVFDHDTMCRPYLLIPALPDLTAGDWTKMEVYRDGGIGGPLQSRISWDKLPEVETIWHPLEIDILSLKMIKWHRSGVHEVLLPNGRLAIAKYACFGWQIPSMERETRAYAILDDFFRDLSEGNVNQIQPLAPTFMAHLTENGRVMGILLEKIDGIFASIEDLSACEDALKRFHATGMIHGDVNRYNFILESTEKRVRLLDFEHTAPYEEDEAREELLSLPAELAEDTGRGGPARIVA
ncbi:MAG: hypothetical protein M1825_000208 [Sarcosagium campestre]|nr:MAG: hypothetical protein M1825_000208 [Sarcosagium campestre]